jgi:hypothetical protein
MMSLYPPDWGADEEEELPLLFFLAEAVLLRAVMVRAFVFRAFVVRASQQKAQSDS